MEKLNGAHLLGKQFANLFSSYTPAFNKVYDNGSLFLKNFKSIEITDRAYLKNLIMYIHLNPTKHVYSTGAEAWLWRSYHTFSTNWSKLKDTLFGNDGVYYAEHVQKKLAFKTYLEAENSIEIAHL